jgi:hypothetical protein
LTENVGRLPAELTLFRPTGQIRGTLDAETGGARFDGLFPKGPAPSMLAREVFNQLMARQLASSVDHVEADSMEIVG